MNKLEFKIVFIFSITCIFFFFLGFFITPISLIYLFFFGVILKVLSMSSKPKAYIYSLTFIMAMIQAYCNYADTVALGTTFNYSDQITSFFLEAENISSLKYSKIVNECLNQPQLNLSHFIFATCLKVESLLFSQKTFLNVLIVISICSSFIPVILYNLLSIYISKQYALSLSIYYALFSIFTLYMGYLLRDQFIALLYLFGFVLLHKKNNFKTLFSLLLIVLLLSQLRFAHAIFFCIFILFNFFFTGRMNLNKIMTIFMIGVCVMTVFQFLVSKIDYLFGLMSRYETLTNETVEIDQGLANKIYKLPFFIKQVAIIFYSQVNFPYWSSYERAQNIMQNILATFDLIGRAGWSFVFFFNIVNIKTLYRWIIRNKTIKILFFVSILFLMSNTTNMTDRRIMAVFPVFFTGFSVIIARISKKELLKSINAFLLLNLAISLIYFKLKYS